MQTIIRILKGLLIVLLFCGILLVTPRLRSVLNPEKLPVGYHFTIPTYLALFLGLEELIDKSPEIPQGIRVFKDIEYKNIDGKSLQLDMYIPENIKKPAPLLVFIHGGGWKGGKRSDYLVYLVPFAQKGFITATVSYRLLKEAPYPACVEDVKDAIAWFFRNGNNFGYDPDRIALVGGSAGAHLALLSAYGWEKPQKTTADTVAIGTIKHKIKAVVDIYGPVDLTTEYARNHPLVTNFIAHSYPEAPGLYREASPISYLDQNDPPTMILHGTSDDLVPVSQSDTLKAMLDRMGVPCVYYRLPLWPHTMDLAKRVNIFSQQKMNDFFEKYLK
jgi:acetyl esterase/lipase